jgi:hypothetical protein
MKPGADDTVPSPPPGFQIIDYTNDPWGWNVQCTDKETQVPNNLEHPKGLNSLQNILDTVKNHPCLQNNNCILAIDSVVPLYMRHGGIKLTLLLQALQELHGVSTILIHATDALPRQLLQTLQDMANAFLFLQDGTAHWLRQGVRERDNMVRQVIDFTITGNKICMEESEIKESSSSTPTTVETTTPVESLERPQTFPSSGRPRIQLKLEEEGQESAAAATAAASTTTSTSSATGAQSTSAIAGPRIYLQDDDPEFEDFDEEDPDDDLDI